MRLLDVNLVNLNKRFCMLLRLKFKIEINFQRHADFADKIHNIKRAMKRWKLELVCGTDNQRCLHQMTDT